jgi:ribosomal protein L29
MFTTKKPVGLIENAALLVEKSKKIKSVFTKMRDDLEDSNVELNFEKEKIDEAVKELTEARFQLSTESLSNDSVIKKIDKILF